MPIKKSNLFGNQTGSSRIDRIKQDTENKIKASYTYGYLVKNETEQNSRMSALSRVRGGGYIVPRKVTRYGGGITAPNSPVDIVAMIFTSNVISVSFSEIDRNGIITSYTVISNLGDISIGTESPIIISGLSSNTLYSFYVTATNSMGTSALSNISNTVTTPPDSPTINTVSIISSTSVSVNFNPPTGSGTIISYIVTSSPGGITGRGTSSPIIVSRLTSNTSYTFTVTAINSGGSSGPSYSTNGIIVRDIINSTVGLIPITNSSSTITTIPDPPTIDIVSMSGTDSIMIYFTPPSGNGEIINYIVTSNLGDVSTGNSSPITVYGLKSNTPYSFFATATNSGGTSTTSNTSNFATTLSEPPYIGNATVSSSTTVSVDFTEPHGNGILTAYTVISNTGISGIGKSSPIIVSGLLPNTSYTFYATATNICGTSKTSNTTSKVITKPSIPIMVLASTINTNNVSVAFTPQNTGDGLIIGYTVICNSGQTITGLSSPIIVSRLKSNTAYIFTVSASNHTGTSMVSTASSATTIPDPPTIGIATIVSPTQISVAFVSPSGGGTLNYTVYSNIGGFSNTGTATPIIVTVTPNTEYFFTMTATNQGGTSASSEPTNMVTP